MNYNVVTLNFKTENNSKNRIYKYVIIFKLRNFTNDVICQLYALVLYSSLRFLFGNGAETPSS